MNVYNKVLYIKIDDEGLFNEEIKPELLKYGYNIDYLSAFNFCPYLILHKDWEIQTKLVCENINDGFLRTLLLHCFCEEFTDINKFLEAALLFTNGLTNIIIENNDGNNTIYSNTRKINDDGTTALF